MYVCEFIKCWREFYSQQICIMQLFQMGAFEVSGNHSDIIVYIGVGQGKKVRFF
jgi:hypothetical protein